MQVLGAGAFYKSKIASVVIIPGNENEGCLKKIPTSTFWNCNCLEVVSLPDSIKSIELTAFEACYVLHTINIPANIKKIGNDDAAKSAGDYRGLGSVFAECEELYEIKIPESVQSIEFIEDNWGKGNFKGCGKLPLATRQKLKDLGYKGKF